MQVRRQPGFCSTPRRARKLAMAALFCAALLAFSPPAHAGDTLAGDAQAAFILVLLLGIVGGGTLVAVNTTFTVNDVSCALDDELPDEDWAGAEGAVGGILAIPLNALVVVAENESRDDVVLRAVLEPATMWTTMLGAHGIWSGAKQEADPAEVLGASAMLGVNIPLTIATVSQAVQGRLSAPATAVVQLATTTPAVVLGSYAAATSPDDSPGWIALTAWSGGLLLHGAASLIWGNDVEPPGSDQRRAWLPAAVDQVAVTPVVLGSSRAPAPGLGLAGQF